MIIKLIQIDVALTTTFDTPLAAGAVLELVTTFHKTLISYTPRLHTSLTKYNEGAKPVPGGFEGMPNAFFKELTQQEYSDLDSNAGALTEVLGFCQTMLEALPEIGDGNTSIVLST